MNAPQTVAVVSNSPWAIGAALLSVATFVLVANFVKRWDQRSRSKTDSRNSMLARVSVLGREITRGAEADAGADLSNRIGFAINCDRVAIYSRNADGQLALVDAVNCGSAPSTLQDSDFFVLNSGCDQHWRSLDRPTLSHGLRPWHHLWQSIFPICDERGEVQSMFLIGDNDQQRVFGEDEVMAIEGLLARFRVSQLARVRSEIDQQKENLAYIGKVTAGVAHDIRFPLSALRTYFEDGDRGLPAELRQELREVAVRGIETISNTIDGISSLARGESFMLSRFDLAELVTEVVSNHASFANGSLARVVNSVESGRHFVLADRDQFGMALGNLLRNSIEEINGLNTKGVVTLGISALRDGFVTLRVSDTGGGLPSDVQEALFSGVVGCSTKATSEVARSTGYGLGLFRARQIITTGHGGAFGYARNSFFLSLKASA